MERWENRTLYGNGANATLVTNDVSKMVISGGGYRGNGLQFDGNGSWAFIDNDIPCFLDKDLCNGLTIALWIRLNSSQNSTNATPIYIVNAGGLNDIQGFAVFIFNDTLNVSFITQKRKVSGGWKDAIPYDTWTHVAMRFDVNQTEIYLNGQYFATTGTPGVGSLSPNTEKITLGKRSDDIGSETAHHAGFVVDDLWLKEGSTRKWRLKIFHTGECMD